MSSGEGFRPPVIDIVCSRLVELVAEHGSPNSWSPSELETSYEPVAVGIAARQYPAGLAQAWKDAGGAGTLRYNGSRRRFEVEPEANPRNITITLRSAGQSERLTEAWATHVARALRALFPECAVVVTSWKAASVNSQDRVEISGLPGTLHGDFERRVTRWLEDERGSELLDAFAHEHGGS